MSTPSEIAILIPYNKLCISKDAYKGKPLNNIFGSKNFEEDFKEEQEYREKCAEVIDKMSQDLEDFKSDKDLLTGTKNP